MCDFPYAHTEFEHLDSLLDEYLLLIRMNDPWYGKFLLYLQTKCSQPDLSHDERHHILHHLKRYLILSDTLYHLGIDSILRRCLIDDNAEFILNDCHSGACGGHLYYLAMA